MSTYESRIFGANHRFANIYNQTSEDTKIIELAVTNNHANRKTGNRKASFITDSGPPDLHLTPGVGSGMTFGAAGIGKVGGGIQMNPELP